MALAIGSIVALKNNSSGGVAGVGFPVRGPVFGIINAGAGPFDVAWNVGGAVATGLIAGSLDEITNGDGVVAAALTGRRVKITSPAGQSNWMQGVCMAVYKRSGTDIALVCIGPDQYLEPLASNVEVA